MTFIWFFVRLFRVAVREVSPERSKRPDPADDAYMFGDESR